jgi:transcriptional regulator with XRE-family HTH domain
MHEVNVSNPLMYRLIDPDLLRRLMQRTGTGAPMSVRQLADAAKIPKSTVDNLLNGGQIATSAEKAHAIAGAIGVDVLVLFEPVGRATGEITTTLTAVSA